MRPACDQVILLVFASFVSQSQSLVTQNQSKRAITFDTQMETALKRKGLSALQTVCVEHCKCSQFISTSEHYYFFSYYFPLPKSTLQHTARAKTKSDTFKNIQSGRENCTVELN